MVFPLYAMAALLLTMFLVKGLVPFARLIELVDKPRGHKSHSDEVPLVGGAAMFFAFFTVLAIGSELPNRGAVLIASLLMVIVGLVDDRRGLSPNARFVAQITAALILIYGGQIAVSNLGDLLFFGAINLGFLAAPFTVFGAVGFMNAMNMADGMDGLAGGLALIAVLGMGFLAWSVDSTEDMFLLRVLGAVLIGFLAFNVRMPWRTRAAIFMGDAGSMFLGLLFIWLLIRLSQGDSPIMTPVTTLWLVAIPLLDTVSVMLRRILKRQSPFEADQQHFHHLLQLAGYSVSQSGSLIFVLAAGFALVGVAGFKLEVPEGIMFIGFVLLFISYFLASNYAWTKLSSNQLQTSIH